ncbi:MAG: hypothetical protein ACXWMI_03515 [Syntrophales bacterium]
MDDLFTKKVRTAAVAGWWTLLIFYCVLLIQWFAYMLIMARQPAGVLCIWGAGASLQEIRAVWLWGMVAFKLCIGMMLFVVVWLSLWARQLSRRKE